MSGLLRSLISGGSRVARSADDAAAVRYLDDLMKSERYADQVRYLDEFYGRTPDAEPVVEVAARTPTTADQFLAAGIPMPSAARRLTEAADAAASAGLGPENAVLREWIESQVPLPSANPRGAAMTSLGSIADSFDESLAAPRRLAAERLAQRRAVLSAAGRNAAPAVIGASAAGIGAMAAADMLAHRQRQQEVADREALAVRLRATPDELFDPVPTEMGFVDGEHDAAIASMLRDARGGYKGMIPSQKFYDIIETLDDPEEQVRLSFDAFSDSDLLEEFRPRPRLPAQGGYR